MFHYSAVTCTPSAAGVNYVILSLSWWAYTPLLSTGLHPLGDYIYMSALAKSRVSWSVYWISKQPLHTCYAAQISFPINWKTSHQCFFSFDWLVSWCTVSNSQTPGVYGAVWPTQCDLGHARRTSWMVMSFDSKTLQSTFRPFTVSLYSPDSRHLPVVTEGSARGLSVVASEKRWRFPSVTWAHDALWLVILAYI